MKQNYPPRWIDRLLDAWAPLHLAEEIKGDLTELFEKDTIEVGRSAARRRYASRALGFLMKSFFWKRSSQHYPFYSMNMLASYFKMATRSLRAYRGTAVINILGLVVGMASAMILFSLVYYEMSFDTFHSDTDRIYRVVRVSGDDKSEFRTGVSYPVPGAMINEVSMLESVAPIRYFGGASVDILNEKGTSVSQFKELQGCVMLGPDFFALFDYHDNPIRWIAGDSKTALKDPFTVVLTKSIAQKYFGSMDVLGKTVQFEKYHTCKVTGVIDDFPSNTDFPFTILISYSTISQLMGDRMQDWTSVDDDHQAYVKLSPGHTQAEAEAAILSMHKGHVSKEMGESRHYRLQPIDELHFDMRFGTFSGRTISHQTLITLTLVAVFLLVAAAINYVNLSTAQSVVRSREIGLRKVLGSGRYALVAQFLTETFVIVLASSIIAVGAAELLLRYLQPVLDIHWNYQFFMKTPVLLTWFGAIVSITLLAGLYPSVVASRFNPVKALSNKFSTGKAGGLAMRKVLVVVQFTMTQIFVAGTFIVITQMRYFQNVDMGFSRNAIITVELPPDPGGQMSSTVFNVLANDLRKKPWIDGVSYSFTLPSGVWRNRSYLDLGHPEADKIKDYIIVEYGSIDTAFLRLYDIPLLAGRNLNAQDTSGTIIINRTAVKNLQLGEPEDAIGVELKRGGGGKATVVGVIEDYYSNSLKEGVDNIMIDMSPFNYYALSIKLDLAGKDMSLADAVHDIEAVWKNQFPQHVFTYGFFEDNVQEFYKQEQKYATLFKLFTGVIMLIGCLGLYGLITFVVNRKGKEVAIRKVLGATLQNILMLFSREYIVLIVLSFLIAVPVAYWCTDQWLSGYRNHITLQWWLFTIPGIAVLAIALLVICLKSLTAARANPVNQLKQE